MKYSRGIRFIAFLLILMLSFGCMSGAVWADETESAESSETVADDGVGNAEAAEATEFTETTAGTENTDDAESDEAAPVGVSTSEYLYDDCADLSVLTAYSEGIYTSYITEENQYAFEGDYTVFMRSTADEQWIEYTVPEGGYFVFYTYFRQNEEVSHFKFEYSVDGENWQEFTPNITQRSVSSDRWIPVIYNLKNLPVEAEYIKMTFQNIGGAEWSPCIASVDFMPSDSGLTGFNDCIDTPYYDATDKLKNLGLVSGYSRYEYRPYNDITRAEFCTLVTSILNLDTTMSDSQPRMFYDIDRDYWGAGAIYALYNLGIVNGDENRNFNPEDNITYDEASKILVSALGYTIMAESDGGYPSGFNLYAQRLGLYDGIDDVTGDRNLNRGEAALMFSNSLDVEIVYQTQFGSDAGYTNDGSTILNKFHNIYVEEGIVTDVGYMSIYSEGNTSGNTFSINNNIYRFGDYDMSDFLGLNAEVYVKRDGSSAAALYAYAEPEQTFEISYNDYLRLEDNRVYYDEDGYERYASVTAETRILYNGKYMSRVGVTDELEFSSGFLKLINNDESGAVDIISISDYATYFVSSGSEISGVVSDRYLGGVSIGTQEADSVRLYEDGREIEFTDDYELNPNQVVQVLKSADGSIITIYVITDQAYGDIEFANAEENIYRIGGTEYKLSEYFINTGQTLEDINEPVTVYLDINGNIVAASASSTYERYGYVQSVGTDSAFGYEISLRIIDQDGASITATADSRTALNGSTRNLNAIANLNQMLIKFTLRDDSTLGQISTYTDNYGNVGLNDFSCNYSSESIKYRGGFNTFASVYQLTAATKIFVVPSSNTDFDNYRVVGLDYLISDYSYNVRLFDVSSDYKVSAAVVYADGSDVRNVMSTDGVAVVQNSGVYINSDGERYLGVTAYVGGTLTEIAFKTDGATDSTGSWLNGYTARNTANGNNPFSPGEVFQYYLDSGECSSFRMFITKDMIDSESFYERNIGDYGALSEESYFSELYTAFGKVMDKFTDKFFISANVVEDYKRTVLNGGTVYVFNTSNNNLSVGDITDVGIGDNVFVRLNFSATGEIVVYI